MATLRPHYDMTTDWDDTTYCRTTLKLNYDKRYVDISMPNYVAKKLTEYDHYQCRNNTIVHRNQYQ